MTEAFTSLARSIVVAVVRRWREARDRGEPTQPAIFATLDRQDCGILAPVFDSLITLFEVSAGRALQVKRASDSDLSADETRLLALLENSGDPDPADALPHRRLGSAMQVAVRSARIMMRQALGAARAERRASRFLRERAVAAG